MKLFCGLFVVLSAIIALSHGEDHRPLEGMQRLSIICKTPEDLSFVQALRDNPNLDFLRLTRILKEPIDVLVTADELPHFKNLLAIRGIEYAVTIDDVEMAVQEEKMRNELARQRSLNRQTYDRVKPFDYYPRFHEIESYLKNLTATYPSLATLHEIGKSYEGRSMYVVKVSTGGANKPAVFIDAGIHAREWIAPSTALYALHQLVTNNSNSELLMNVDWYILPSLNPDGYEYTHTTYRFWRKTRSVNPTSSCIGTDANRNFGLKWMTIGASSNPCSDTYAGSKPFSEPETQAVRDFLLAHKGIIKAYLTLHSYGQYLLHPWGYTSDLPESEPLLRTAAEEAANALAAVRGTQYTVGSSTNVLYAAAGGSDDYAFGVADAALAYTIELPGGRFDPESYLIAPVGIETFEAIRVFHNYVESLK